MSSGNRAVINRSSIVHIGTRVVAVSGIQTDKPESRKELTEFAEFAEPLLRCFGCPSKLLELSLSVSDVWLKSELVSTEEESRSRPYRHASR